MTSNIPFNKLSPAKQDEFRCQFPCAGFWLGALPPLTDLAPYYHPHVVHVEQAAPGLMGPGVPPYPNQCAPATHHQGQAVAAPLMHAPVVPACMLSLLLKKPLRCH